jgi:hypothetical protein
VVGSTLLRGIYRLTTQRIGCDNVKEATERLPRGKCRLTVPRIGYGRVNEATTRLSRGSYRLTVPRIGCDKVKAATIRLTVPRRGFVATPVDRGRSGPRLSNS